METESRFQGLWGRGNLELLSGEYRISVMQDKESWGWMIMMVAQQCELYLMTLNFTLKKWLKW